jgi:acyl-CoA thioesterase FadM
VRWTSTGGEVIGLVIETQCNYFAPLAFPQTIEAGLRVARLGGSSVRYEVGLFAQGEAADGRLRPLHPCLRGPAEPASGGAAAVLKNTLQQLL